MRVLVACEESQAVTIELRKLGHEAYSCDIEPCSGGHPEWHIQQDVIPLINGRCSFVTCDGAEHTVDDRWDMIIAFPPCTYLTCTGNKWFKKEYKERFPTRQHDREEAIKFFMAFVNADCDKIAIENPIGIMSTKYRKPDQIIQPYWFGHTEKKSTCLWLKGLPKLIPTNMVEPILHKTKSGKYEPNWHMNTINFTKKERSKARSKTYLGVASAMAWQWTADNFEIMTGTFLDISCSNEEFLIDILIRKLKVCEGITDGIIAIDSIFAVYKEKGKVEKLKEKIKSIFYASFEDNELDELIDVLLSKNIVCGDFLTGFDSSGHIIWFLQNGLDSNKGCFETIIESNWGKEVSL